MDFNDAQDLMRGMVAKQQQLTQKNDEYPILAEDKAQKERAYRMAKAKKIVELRANGEPVTIITDLVKGDSLVSQLRLEYVVAEGVLKACINSIKGILSAIDTYRSMLSFVKSERQS
jgi:hypothetical protein